MTPLIFYFKEDQMAKITTLDVQGFDAALHGMRLPYKSLARADTVDGEIGENDTKLSKSLLASKHDCDAKFMRMIYVWADFQMPRYWHSENDTYKFVDKNSESTMHTLMTKDGEFTLDMFEHDDSPFEINAITNACISLNELRVLYQDAKNNGDSDMMRQCLKSAKRILPESFLQTRTICTNYQELRNMYRQRKNHRLPEWNTVFVNWVYTLPYSWMITGEDE